MDPKAKLRKAMQYSSMLKAKDAQSLIHYLVIARVQGKEPLSASLRTSSAQRLPWRGLNLTFYSLETTI